MKVSKIVEKVVKEEVTKDLKMPVFSGGKHSSMCANFGCHDNEGNHISCYNCILSPDNYKFLREE